MYRQSASRHPAANPALASIIESDTSAAVPVEDRIRFAKKATCFAHEREVTLKQFPQWLEASDARPELSCGLVWLKTLLPGQGEEAVVRNGVDKLASLLLDSGRIKTEDLLSLYGPIKRDLHVLCETLQAAPAPAPSMVAAACRELRSAFGAAQGLGTVDAIASAIERAVSAVEDQFPSPQRRCEAQAPRPVPRPRQSLLAGPKPVVDSPRGPVEKSLPKSDGVVLAQASMDIGTEEVRERHEQLGASFDRLISLMPPDTEDSVLKGLIAWRDSYSIPTIRSDANHAEMLDVGKDVLTLLCDVLDMLNPEQLRGAAGCLAHYMPNEHSRRIRVTPGRRVYNSPGSHVTKLVYTLVDAESIRDDIRNPHRDERRRRFDAWAAPLLASSTLTKKQVSSAMEDLGLDFEVGFGEEGRSQMPPVLNNAAWRACLGIPSPRASAAESLPKSDDVVLTRNLVDMGMAQVRQRCTRFGTQVDRLLAFVPQSMHTLRERLISLRDRHATPSTGFDGQHAEMLEVGHHVLTLLCNEFKKLDPAKHRMALNLLAMSVPQWNYLGSHVRGLVNALIDVESTDTGEHNPHLNERRKRFEDWAEPLMASSRLTENDFRRGMEALGLDTDHNLDVERMDPWLHPVYNIAAWQACLEIPFDPNDLPPLADVGKADLILALDALRQRCEGLRMDTAALDRFSDNWLAKKPSGERRDSVAELQGVGVDALWDINKYLAGKDGRTAKLEMLANLFRALKNAENPATELFDRAQRTKA